MQDQKRVADDVAKEMEGGNEDSEVNEKFFGMRRLAVAFITNTVANDNIFYSYR